MKTLALQATFLCVFALLHAAPIDEIEGGVVAEPTPDDVGEYGDHFQGDLQLTVDQQHAIEDHDGDNNENRAGKTGLLSTTTRWPKSGGIVYVPYVIAYGYSSTEISRIRTAMNDIESKTSCIRFISRTTQNDYVNIFSGSGCWSWLGRIGGAQDVSLSRSGCVYHGTIMHELIHALGYGHMQQHYERDSLVRINWENIQSGKEHNFNKVDPNYYGNFGTSYDLDSVMHYGSTSFSKNGRYTITALNSGNQYRIGQRDRLSGGDITRIKNMYQC